MKKVASIILLASSGIAPLFGIGLGNYQVSPEIGVNLSYQNDKDRFTYGGYARVWLGVSRVVFAPQVKYDVITKSSKHVDDSYKNVQVGGLFGYEIPVLPLTPYVGVSWSGFEDVNLKNTFAINYGIKAKIPIIPLTVGLDGSWQKPGIIGGGRYEINRIGATVGLSF